MQQVEYERLQKAHQIQSDLSVIREAISVLMKKPRMNVKFSKISDEEVVGMAVNRFIKDEDIVGILSQKLNNLETEFAKL